jgi:hypothetical protein
MAKNLTESSTFTANVSVPEAADARTAASVENAFQALTNRAKWLYDRIVQLLPVASTSVTRWVGTGYQSSANQGATDSGWFHAYLDPGSALSDGAARAKRLISFDHVLPNGCTITQVRVRIDPLNAQATAADRMNAQVMVNSQAGLAAIAAGATSAVTYSDATNAAQWITISGLAIVVDKTTKSYAVAVCNSVDYAGDYIHGAEVTFTTSKLFVD